jgi:hypothetical protein
MRAKSAIDAGDLLRPRLPPTSRVRTDGCFGIILAPQAEPRAAPQSLPDMIGFEARERACSSFIHRAQAELAGLSQHLPSKASQ